MQLVLLAVLTLLVCCPLSSADTTPKKIALRSGMSALRSPGVPLLSDQVPDADWEKPGASIEPAKAYQWLVDSGNFNATVKLEDTKKADRAVLTVWDWENRPVAQEKLTTPFSQDFEFNVIGKGTYLLTLDGFLGEKCVWRLARSFSVCPSNEAKRKLWEKNGFFVGICAFPERQIQGWKNKYGLPTPPGLTPEESWRMDLDLIARSGMQVVRLDAIASDKPEDNWLDSQAMEPIMQAYAARGLKADLQIWGPSPLLDKYKDVTGGWRYPRKEEPYRLYVRESAKRYAKYARFIEIWNEADNLDFWRGTPEEYIREHKSAVEEIRAVAPKAIITNGGFCLNKPDWTPIMASGIKGTTDIVAYHSHGDLPGVKSVFERIVKIHDEAGYRSPKYINTETGYAAWRLDQERTQATTAIQKLLYYWSKGNLGALLYVSRDVGGPRIRTDDPDWGIVDYFMCPRFAYGAVSAFIDTFAGVRFAETLAEDDNLHVYRFSQGDRQLVAAFAVGKPVEVAFSVKCTSAEIIDAMGNRRPAGSGKAVKVAAGNYPVILVFRDAKRVNLIQTD